MQPRRAARKGFFFSSGIFLTARKFNITHLSIFPAASQVGASHLNGPCAQPFGRVWCQVQQQADSRTCDRTSIKISLFTLQSQFFPPPTHCWECDSLRLGAWVRQPLRDGDRPHRGDRPGNVHPFHICIAVFNEGCRVSLPRCSLMCTRVSGNVIISLHFQSLHR